MLTAAIAAGILAAAPPMPSHTAEDAAVLAPVHALLGAIASGDRQALMAVVRGEGGATAAFDLPARHKVARLGWAEFATSIGGGPDVIRERLIDPTVTIDRDVAMVWSRYVFTVNGRIKHCGVDHFDLVRVDGSWKVLNATWSERTTECSAR